MEKAELIAKGKARPGDTFLSVTIGSDTDTRHKRREGVQVVIGGGGGVQSE
jgi:hypothetical protein